MRGGWTHCPGCVRERDVDQVTYPIVGQIHRHSPARRRRRPDAQIQQLADGFIWAEGPVWVRDGGYLVFSDVPGNVMYRWSQADGSASS
jgi:gluconolactonase